MVSDMFMIRPPELNRIGEFRNHETEKAYFIRYLDQSRGLLSALLLLTPIAYLLMLLLNYYSMGPTQAFAVNVMMRLGLVILFFSLFLYARVATNRLRLYRLVVASSVFLVVHYQMLVIINRSTIFAQQAMSFFLLVVILFMVPIRWIYNLLLSVGATLSFFLCFYLFFGEEPLYQYIRYLVYFSLGIFSSSYVSYNLHLHRRMQYMRENHLEVLSCTDPLTKAYNRQYLDEMLAHWMWKAEAGGDFSLIMFDLDDFKRLNDTYGHDVGDVVLVEISQLAKDHLRERDVFARWGGEEFMIILPDIGSEIAVIIAQRLCDEVELHFREQYKMTASFGVTGYQQGDTAESLLQRVDAKLYEAKRLGKNRVAG